MQARTRFFPFFLAYLVFLLYLCGMIGKRWIIGCWIAAMGGCLMAESINPGSSVRYLLQNCGWLQISCPSLLQSCLLNQYRQSHCRCMNKRAKPTFQMLPKQRVSIKILTESRSRFFGMKQTHLYAAFQQIAEYLQKRHSIILALHDIQVFEVRGRYP